MNAWLVPALAGGLWLALLARPSVGDLVPAPAWFAAGALALGAAIVLAPRSSAEAEPLRRADVFGPGAPAIDALAPASLERGRHPAWLPPALALAGVLLLGVGWGSAHAHRVEDALLARLATERVEIVGTLRVDPRQDIDGWSAVVDVREVRWSAGAATVHESVWVDALDEAPDAMRGDRVRLTGQLLVPDEPGFASFLLRRGIAAELRTTEAVRLGPSEVAFVRWSQRARVALADSITALFPPREAGLLLGLAVGDDSRLDPTVERDFRATGLSHLLVVSGGNVAMVLAPILGLAAALRLTRWPRFAIGLGTVTFFVVLTGAEPSVMRAGVMTGLALVGVLLGRPRSAATILSAAVFGLLVIDPALVWSVGFQLSVAATGGMVALASPLADRFSVLPRPLAIALGATLAAQLGVTPVLLFHFNEVPLSTILANVAAFPAVSPGVAARPVRGRRRRRRSSRSPGSSQASRSSRCATSIDGRRPPRAGADPVDHRRRGASHSAERKPRPSYIAIASRLETRTSSVIGSSAPPPVSSKRRRIRRLATPARRRSGATATFIRCQTWS